MIRTSSGLFIAIASLVAVGVAVHYSTNVLLANLMETQKAFWGEARSADYYFEVVRAPERIVSQLRQLPGVSEAMGRIRKDVKIVRDGRASDTAIVISYGAREDTPLNRLFVSKGRYFDNTRSGDIEVLVDRQYATSKAINPGDVLTVIAGGQQVPLKVVGLAISTEYLCKTRNALELPDWDGLAVIMMPHDRARQLFRMPGEINQVLTRFVPNVHESVIRDVIQDKLHPFGMVASYPLRDQPSYSYNKGRIETLRIASTLFPPGIFLAAILSLAVLVHRLIRSHQRPIGIMKALGYDQQQIVLLYTGYALAVSAAGTCAGVLIGSIMASGMTDFVQKNVDLPFKAIHMHGKLLLESGGVSMFFGLLAGLIASREVAKIEPAVAFRTRIASAHGKRPHAAWEKVARNGSSAWKMAVRSISRNRLRFFTMAFGIVLCTGVTLVTMYFTDSRASMLKRYFGDEHRYDYTVRFNKPVPVDSISTWYKWPEVQLLEPALELPVTISRLDRHGAGRKQREDVVIGVEPAGKLRSIHDADYQPLAIPSDGIVVGRLIARKLSVSTGDQVLVATKPGMGPRREKIFTVRGVAVQNIGSNSFMSLAQVNNLLGENRAINSVMVRSSPLMVKRLEERFAEIPGIASVSSKEKQQMNAMRLLEATMYVSKLTIIFSLLLGVSIVSAILVLSYKERAREFAILRTLGWSEDNVALVFRHEIALAFVIGIFLSLPTAKFIGDYCMKELSGETFIWPLTLFPATYATAMLCTVAFTITGYMIAVRQIKKLDLVENLKERE